MDWNNVGAMIAVIITATGGASGLALLVNAWAARRSAANLASVDLRKVTDAAASALIADLQRHRLECEQQMAIMEKRVEMLERIIPALKMRDSILVGTIMDSGLTMPRLPNVVWPDGK